MAPTLILGIGNLLLGDEGVGVHAAQRLLALPPAPGLQVLEVGTAILDALPAIATAGRLIILDAMKADGQPGTVYRVALDRCQSAPAIGSMHGIDLARVLTLAGRADWPEVVAFGVEPAHIGWSMALSPEVEKALPFLLAAVEAETVPNPTCFPLRPAHPTSTPSLKTAYPPF